MMQSFKILEQFTAFYILYFICLLSRGAPVHSASLPILRSTIYTPNPNENLDKARAMIVGKSTGSDAAAQKARRIQLLNFCAGGLAGSVSSTLTIPLEVIKTQLQSSRIGSHASVATVAKKIMEVDGLKGFFKGLAPMLVGILPTRAIYFWAYQATKESLNEIGGLRDSSWNHLASAFAAGVASNTITNPLWMVKTRFQIMADPTVGQRMYENYGQVIRAIWKENGIGGFYKGLTASYIGCIEGAIHWVIYEKAKVYINTQSLTQRQDSDSLSNQKLSPNPAQLFLASGFSKFVAICATYPHEVVRTRLREQATKGVFKYNGFLNTLSIVAKEEGIRGLYGGLGMHLIRSVPNAAIMFTTFEIMSVWLQKNHA